MRLYPPAWLVTRQSLEEDEVGGYRIPARSVVILSPYLTHRHPDFWDEPERFDPERFQPERVQARPRFAYFPFSGGPRQCIGNSFAMMELQIVMAMVAQAYRPRLVPDHPVALLPTVTLRPRHGLRMVLERL
jgi:cytochrome P450